MMMQRRTVEIAVGIFMLLGLISLIMLAFKVSGLTQIYDKNHGYELKSYFSNIGGLKIRARVTVSGVNIGRVRYITIDPTTYEAVVTVFINAKYALPRDSSARILTSGLIGDNYLSVEPGADEESLHQGDIIEETHSAVILEELIGQFIYKSSDTD